MIKATKMTFAALLLAGSTGLAMAQGADSGGTATGKPANSDTLNTSKQQSQELQNKGATGGTMMQKNTGMPSGDARGPANAGPDEAGTAKDTAGSGTQRNPAAQKQ
jgi:hypothetical protein